MQIYRMSSGFCWQREADMHRLACDGVSVFAPVFVSVFFSVFVSVFACIFICLVPVFLAVRSRYVWAGPCQTAAMQ